MLDANSLTGEELVAISNQNIVASEFGVPLEKIVNLPILSQCEVRAGETGLGRIVAGVNIMEVPDIIEWVTSGQLLITAGYAIRDDESAQKSLIALLAQKGLAGICIKTKRYLDEIPSSMLMQADLYNFPIIELSKDIKFADLMHDVLSAILSEQTAYLSKMLDVHSRLMKIMIDGGELQKIVDTIASLIDNPVFIIDGINNRYVSSNDIEFESKNDPILEFIMNGKKTSKVISNPFNGRINLKINGSDECCFFMPIMVSSECYGSIIIWERDCSLTSNDAYVIEKLSIATALEIARERSLRQVEYRYSNEYLLHLLTGHIEDEIIEVEQASKFGWDLNKNYVVAVIWLSDLRDNKRQFLSQEMMSHLLGKLPRILKERGYDSLVGSKGDYIIVLLDVEEVKDESIRQVNNAAKLKLEVVLEFLKREYNKYDIHIGLGSFHQGIKGLQTSYQEAKQAIQIGEKTPNFKEIISFYDLGIYRLIYAQNRDKETRVYLEETLGELIKYDREKNTELIRTLQVYFECHGNLKKVSEVLFTHYNTILYRMDRIQKISGCDLDCPEDRFNLEVALRLL